MRKLFKLAAVGVLSLSMGVAAMPSNTLTAGAKTRSATVISSKSMKKTAYHINGGYIYTSAKLTKKSHNGKNYLNTTFYATKSATVKKTNGKKAVYYYIKNSKGSVKGWAWRGNFSKIDMKALNQRKSDIKKMLAAIRMMSADHQDYALSDISGVNTTNTYESYGLAAAVSDMSIGSSNLQDAKAMSAAYQIFAGRFNSVTNAQLATLNSRLTDVIRSNDSDTDFYQPVYNMSQALSNAIETLQ